MSSPAEKSILFHLTAVRFALNLPTPTKAIEVVGKTKIWVDTAESGNHSNRHFCGDCGS